MPEKTKKYLVIGFVVVFILVAGIIFCRNMLGHNSNQIGSNHSIALWCTKCNGYRISANEFRKHISKNPPDMVPIMPGKPMVIRCPRCSQKSCYIAQKCPQCESIFMLGQAKDQNYPDRCPKCRFSVIEKSQKGSK